MHEHIISALVENKAGVLSRVAGLFSSRGYNIDSLVVSRTEDPGLSRMTLVVFGDDLIIEQIRKQLERLIDTIKVRDLTQLEYVARDFLIMKVNAQASKRGEICDLVNLFKGEVLDATRNEIIVEVSGDEDKLDSFIELIRPYGIKELAKTGTVALTKGKKQ